MALSSLLSRFVPATVRRRGVRYHLERRVREVVQGDDRFAAKVRGTRRYDVELVRESDALQYACDCPYFDSNLEPCKHVWAAILEAERRGWLAGKPTPTRLDLVDGPRKDADAWHRDVIEEGDGPQSAPAPTKGGIDSRPSSGGIGAEELLRVLAPAVPSPSALRERGEILYVVDVAATKANGALTMFLERRRRRLDGTWSPTRRLRIGSNEIGRLPDPSDRQILSTLAPPGNAPTPWGWSYSQPLPNPVAFVQESTHIVLEQVCRTGRAFVRTAKEGESLPMRWEGGAPWKVVVRLLPQEEREGFLLDAELRRGAERLAIASPQFLTSSGLFLREEEFGTFEPVESFPLLARLRKEGPVRVSESDAWRIVATLRTRAGAADVEASPELPIEEVRVPPRPIVRVLEPRPYRVSQGLLARLSFEYPGFTFDDGDATPAGLDTASRRVVFRDCGHEERASAAVKEAGFRPAKVDPRRPEARWRISQGRLGAAIGRLLRAGFRVEAEGKRWVSHSSFRIEVASGIDWFELRGGAEYEGEVVPLPAILAALARRDGAILLGDGSFGLLPEEWLARYASVAALGTWEDGAVRFARSQATLLDALLAALPEARADEAFERARAKLSRFERIEALDPARGFRGTLRPYQKAGLGWFRFLREFGFGGCLADDMGLGKTVQVLALLEERRAAKRSLGAGRKPSLVVAPRSVVLNWKSEAERFAPRLSVHDHTGPGRSREAGAFRGHDLVLTSYGTLRRDATLFAGAEFDYVVLDEAQTVKNFGTQSAKAARLLRGEHRLALSGTPIENHLGELWSLFEFLNPGMLGASSAFQLGAEAAREPDGEARALLARALRPFLLRRTKEQVAPELPPKTEQTIVCELEPRQRRLYDELRNHYRASLLGSVDERGLAKSKILVLEALLRLRQAACHPGLLDAGRADEPSAKLDLLLPRIEEIREEGHKALVFSQFTSFLALIRRGLDAREVPYAYLDGATPARRREAEVERFQTDPGCSLFLVSLKAGGLGLNLTAADYVYLLDPWWNPAVEAQAVDRAHRIGRSKPVFAYRLVAADTVEEKILEMQKRKRALADAILSADGSLIRDLTREDLERLLS